MNPRDLIRIARHLASGGVGGGRGRPRQAELRRAVSTAYYALFHALALCCANALAGPNRNRSSWDQTYRALEHGHARNQCNDKVAMSRFSAEIQDFGKKFVLVQQRRQQADYSTNAGFDRDQVLQIIVEAEDAVAELENAPGAERRDFALHVLLRRRRE